MLPNLKLNTQQYPKLLEGNKNVLVSVNNIFTLKSVHRRENVFRSKFEATEENRVKEMEDRVNIL